MMRGLRFWSRAVLDETHEDLMIFDALVRAIAEGDLAEDDMVAQQTFRKVVMGADVRHFQACDQWRPQRSLRARIGL